MTGCRNAVLMMARLASGSTGVVTVEELLARSGSGVGEVTLASLVTVPVVDAFTVTWTYTLAPAPARTVPMSHVTVAAAVVQGPPCVGVAPTKVTLPGRRVCDDHRRGVRGPGVDHQEGVRGRSPG